MPYAPGALLCWSVARINQRTTNSSPISILHNTSTEMPRDTGPRARQDSPTPTQTQTRTLTQAQTLIKEETWDKDGIISLSLSLSRSLARSLSPHTHTRTHRHTVDAILIQSARRHPGQQHLQAPPREPTDWRIATSDRAGA